ncbi:hypothetical protein DV735_g441, partial [Chaetothyriales sp. CBS 134920]
MGKGKGRKARTSAVEDLLHAAHEPHCMCHHNPPRAADGHNVNGWTDEDIRIYNELLTERAKLEKEKNELEQKSARHQAERALLNEDAAAFDSLFKAQLGGEFKFTGKGPCCLEVFNDSSQSSAINTVCHHEICSRAKSHGVSWMEMDTLKYYQTRISSEKSQRMKNALRKQRDVELARVKKDDEEEQALRLRKSAFQDKAFAGKDEMISPSLGSQGGGQGSGQGSDLAVREKKGLVDPKENDILEAAKENEAVVKRIRTRLDKIRHDVSSGRVNAFDARAKLDQANRDMAEAERKNNTFKEMVFSAGTSQGLTTTKPTNLSRALSRSLGSSGGDAFSQALNVVKGFFSASDPSDVQAAITDLRCVLEVNGPMSPVLQKSFKALEDMLAKPNAKGFSVDLTNKDGTKRTCTNVVDVLLMLRNSEDRTKLDATAAELKLDKATLQANTECIKVERQALQEMRDIARGMTSHLTLAQHREYLERLRQVKDEAAMKSPIPPLSDIVLEQDLNTLFYTIECTDLFNQIQDHGFGERDVAGKITSMIIAFSDRDPERYLTTLQHMSNALRMFRADLEHINIVSRALETVRDSMGNLAAVDSLVPGPLQPKKIAKSNQAATKQMAIAAAQLAKPEMSGVIQVVQNMQQQLRGLTADDLINMLCTPESGQSDAHATGVLKGDLQKFLNLPTGLEDPKLLSRIHQQIAQLAANDHSLALKLTNGAADAKSKASRESKFQEDLPGGIPPSPPPYTANEGRVRSSAKLKHVPVNTPHISGPSASSTSTFTSASDVADCQPSFSAARDFEGKTLEQKAQEMSNDLQKMRKDLLELTNLPGLSGNLAKKVRRHLDSLRRDMETMDVAADGNTNNGAPGSLRDISSPTTSAPVPAPGSAAAALTLPIRSASQSFDTNDEQVVASNSKSAKRKQKKKPAKAPPPPMSERELRIQRQLYTLACSLDRLVDTPSTSLSLTLPGSVNTASKTPSTASWASWRNK